MRPVAVVRVTCDGGCLQRARDDVRPITWELCGGVLAAGRDQGEGAAVALTGDFTLGTRHDGIHHCYWGMLFSSISSSCCWISASTLAQSFLFCKAFLAHHVMLLSVKELLSPVYPYLALSASLFSASIPPFCIYQHCLPTSLAFFHAITFTHGRLPDLIKTYLLCLAALFF